jgi:3-oxoacyl-[acyl-carrier-protein] synthase-3
MVPGRFVLEAREEDGAEPRGILATKLHADGAHNQLLYVDGGPSTTGTVGKLRMRGKEVFRHAVTNLAEVLGEVLDDAGLEVADLDWVVPHQANARILDATARKLGIAPERVIVTVDTAIRDGRIKQGDLVMLEAMGGGFTWGASLLRM